MDPNADLRVAGLDERLDGFLERLTASLGREDRRHWARAYVAGLLLDGQRKSVQPLAARLGPRTTGRPCTTSSPRARGPARASRRP